MTGEKPSAAAIGGGVMILIAVLASSLVGMRRQRIAGQAGRQQNE